MTKHLICPNTPTCPIYEVWEKQIDNRLDIILYQEEKREECYSCLALDALRDVESGIEVPEELRKRFSQEEFGQCAEIALLNLLPSRK